MKIYSKLLAFILCLTLVFSVSTLFFGVSAETEGGDTASDTTVGENTEDTPESVEKEEKEENFFEAFASMFKEFHPIGFVENLKYMGIGMLGIFIIIGIIIVATVVINKSFSSREKKEENSKINYKGKMTAKPSFFSFSSQYYVAKRKTFLKHLFLYRAFGTTCCL